MKHPHKSEFESTALLLQGGGALGAYQGGVYQALSEAGLEPDWVAGISIGALNAAIIAGNAPKDRVAKLRQFWESITTDDPAYAFPTLARIYKDNRPQHQWLNFISAANALFTGIPGFFSPRPLMPWFAPDGTKESISFYDSTALKSTLEKVIDFERLNNCDMRFTIGAVEITSGNFVTFDRDEHRITVEHVMASGALPPGLPPVEIDGKSYWDGGMISNTPLMWLFKSRIYIDTLVFQVDLWSADGEFPQNMAEALTREKDIRYSSRTRANTDNFRERHKVRHAISDLLDNLSANLRKLPAYKILKNYSDHKFYNLVHLIYHNKPYEGYSKDFEFSRSSMEMHWKSGYDATLRALKHPEILKLPKNEEGIGVYDFSKDGRRILAEKKLRKTA